MASTNADKVQKAYIAYYGRPADPGGLNYWVGQLDEGVKFDIMLKAFGTSDEAVTLFGNKNPEETIQTLFQQILGRTPDAGGLAFYVGKLNDGSMTGITIAQNVLDGATGDDAAIVTNKLAVADAFNKALDTADERAAYTGATAVVTLRNMLATVDETTVPVLFDVDTSIETLVSAATTATNTVSNETQIQYFLVTASGGNFIISGQANKALTFESGFTYTFDLSDASLEGHPLRFSTASGGTVNSGNAYLTEVIVSGAQGKAGASISIAVTESTPDNLFYYCTNHAGMGAAISVSHYTNMSADTSATVAIFSYANSVPSSNEIQAIDLIGISPEAGLFI